MRTMKIILALLTLSGFLLAQTDSTSVDPPQEIAVQSDSLDVVSSEISIVDSLASSEVELDSIATDFLTLDTSAVDSAGLVENDTLVAPETEMVWLPKTPAPVTVSGLMNQGSTYYWSNDGLAALDFSHMEYVTIIEASIIALKAIDCADIVCHLLASDSSGVDYVIMTPEDSSDFKVFDTETSSVMLEAPSDSILIVFHEFLQEMAGMEYVAVAAPEAAFIGPTLPESDIATLGTSKSDMLRLKVLHNQYRSFEALAANPANNGREFDSFVSLNLLPNIKLGVRNSLLTPGWFKEWLTIGGVWDESMKSDFRETFEDKSLSLNISQKSNIFGVRVWRIGVNVSSQTALRVNLPGNLLALPFQDILFNNTIDNSGIEVEANPVVGNFSLSYAHPLTTPFGDIKVGAAVNTYLGAGYTRISSDNFTAVNTMDSVNVSASGEAWYADVGIDGRLDSIIANIDDAFEDFEVGNTISKPGFGIDLGMIMDLKPLTQQDVEVQLAVRNIGASYTMTGITHTAWSLEQVIPTPDADDLDDMELYIEDFQSAEELVIGTDEELTVDIPTVLSISATYQPIPRVLLGAGIEKAFLEEDRFGYTSDLILNYQLNLYATSWLDFSYYKHNQYGEPVHTFGSGLHFGFLETGLHVSLYNGLNTNAKGVGLGFHSSLHF